MRPGNLRDVGMHGVVKAGLDFTFFSACNIIEKIPYTGILRRSPFGEIKSNHSRESERDTERKRIELEQASALTSISKSMLSQLERGEVNPTILPCITFTGLKSSGDRVYRWISQAVS